ncbi:heat shock factor protein 5 isoform X2 [Danio rerio]|uniref:Heat shock factor protein 5 n=1 Tax=Danio rerio TaxID=7955 RepID=A4QNW9_DANRE|nr:heat shock factor protein 5 [Danio rerio]AAI39553.1 Zgc:162225 protein [Danio rerio]AAI71418.1 Zgc:162225 [Danio rerio]AAI71424.1 Zgc:162225 [Danio rerio]|eukprot:NP_001082945.1 heat shock factor protein 5 [Danio rerio]
MAMDCDYSLLNVNINYHNFPAKLWRLTNNPQNSSVFWSPTGESLIVDQQQFEVDLLTPIKLDNKPFKTSNFTSFIRQLNLYGFKKIFDGSPRDKHRNRHHFYNPNFRRGQPELLVHLKRLTLSKKTKTKIGEKESCRPLSRGQQKTQRNPAEENRGSAQLSGGAAHQQPEYEQSPMTGHSWIFPCADASSFYSNTGLPLSVYPYSSMPVGPHSGPAFLFPQDIPHHLSYPAGLYSPVCQCCTHTQADQAGGNQTSHLSYSHYAYYPNYSVSHQQSSFQPTNWPVHHVSEQRGDMNLDRAFRMVDDFQGLSNVRIVQVGPPVKPQLISNPPLYTIPSAPKAQSVSLQSIETMTFSPPKDTDTYEDHSQIKADLESLEQLKDGGLSFKVTIENVKEENIRNELQINTHRSSFWTDSDF